MFHLFRLKLDHFTILIYKMELVVVLKHLDVNFCHMILKFQGKIYLEIRTIRLIKKKEP